METTSRNFLEYIKDTKGSSNNTILAYQSDLAQFAEQIGSKLGRAASPADINVENTKHYIEWLSGRGYRPSTVARKIAAVRSYIDYLVRFKIIPNPGLDAYLQAEATPRRKPRILSREEIERLVSGPSQKTTPRNLRDAAILMVLFETGLRAADLVGLQLSDIDQHNAVILRDPPEIQLQLRDAAAGLKQYLVEGRPHLSKFPDEQAVFLNQRGRQLSRQGLWLIVKRWANKAGLGDDVSPHTLRHTLAYMLLQDGQSRKAVQDILGLSSPNSIRVLSKMEEEEAE